MAEHYPTKSVAVLAEQGKVTGWEQPASNATQLDSGLGDEIDALGDAQVVSTNKPEFVAKADDPVSLQKGPKKKYIDGKPNNGNDDNDSSSEDGIKVGTRQVSYHVDVTDNTSPKPPQPQQQQQQTDQSHVQFQPQTETTATTTTAEPTNTNTNDFGGGMDDFFGTNDDNNNDDNNDSTNNDNDNNNNGKKRAAPTNNATMISLPNVDNEYHDDFDEDFDDDVAYDVDITNNNNNQSNNNESKTQEQESTVLSLWQQERRGILEERMQNEKTKQRESQEEAQNDLKDFLQKREERMTKARDAAKAREDDIRNEYSSVYKNGTIWQQVAKLVDLTTQDETVERMRDLIIDLKNQSKQ